MKKDLSAFFAHKLMYSYFQAKLPNHAAACITNPVTMYIILWHFKSFFSEQKRAAENDYTYLYIYLQCHIYNM